jgi:GxxExxY protein
MSSTGVRPKLSPNQISKIVIEAALKVHSTLGPGLLESAYEASLAQELRLRGLHVETQVAVPVVYEGIKLEVGYRIDLLVENCVIVEVKSVDAIAPVHRAQVLTYLRLSGKSLGLLINFNVVHLKEGIHRFVMGTSWK